MLRAAITGLLMLAGSAMAAHATVGPVKTGDTMAMLRAQAAPKPAGLDECEAANVLRRLSGCSSVIGSGDVTGPALARAYRNRGMALFSLGEKERAIEDFDQAIRHDPSNAGLYLARGTTWQHIGKHARAIDDLNRALEIEPSNAAAYGNLGVAWEKLGDDDRALENYDRSLTLEPDNAVVLNNRGNVLARMGERRKAIADYDRALGLDPEYASAYYNRAGELCLEGHSGQALSDYLHAIRLGERQRVALEDFLARQGYYESAAQAPTGRLEAALRRWSERACTPPAAEAAANGGDPGQAGLPREGAI